MSVKPDRWIRRMALEHRMIEPFEEKQVRQGVVSYGLSSYGYDIRIGDEFKIFTNINSSIVDPKSFDPKSFVDFKGDVCIIPPNSFALARTVEYFRIPRNVITVCVGKCLAGEARVVDASSGTLRPIRVAASRPAATAALRRERVVQADVSEGAMTGRLPVFDVTTRTGRKLRATPNHPLLTFRGWRPLHELPPGARVGVPRRLPVFGSREMPPWEVELLGLMLSDGQCATPGCSPVYTSGDPALRDAFVRALERFGGVARVRDTFSLRATNAGRRGGRMEPNRVYRWLASLGVAVRSPEKFVPAPVFELRRDLLAHFLRALFSGDGGISIARHAAVHLEFTSTSECLARDVQHLLLRFGVVALLRSRATASGRGAFVLGITSKDEIVRFAGEIGFLPGSRKQRRLEEALEQIRRHPQEKSNYDTLPSEAWGLWRDVCHVQGTSLRAMGLDATQPRQSMSRGLALNLAQRLGNEMLGAIAEGDVLWDVIRDVRFAGVEPVFDLTVPEAQNFVANDFLVHNSTYARCGIIVNVTPFEPEWEGIVTLEISNTTPLPAKIYANEGIAQVLFFESDEPCETSYADKKGKYQAQTTLTLPRL
jgi:deoxycytidine triphosphate deaminase